MSSLYGISFHLIYRLWSWSVGKYQSVEWKTSAAVTRERGKRQDNNRDNLKGMRLLSSMSNRVIGLKNRSLISDGYQIFHKSRSTSDAIRACSANNRKDKWIYKICLYVFLIWLSHLINCGMMSCSINWLKPRFHRPCFSHVAFLLQNLPDERWETCSLVFPPPESVLGYVL